MWLLNWKDLLSFGVAGLLATIAAVLALVYGGMEKGLIACAAAAVVWVIYLRGRIWPRWRLWKKAVGVTRHGLRVVPEDVPVGKLELVGGVERATELALMDWEDAAGARVREMVRGTVLIVQAAPFEMHGWGGKYRGVTLRGSKTVVVAWRSPMDRSALGHELGHVILREMGERWDEEALRKWATERGVPY